MKNAKNLIALTLVILMTALSLAACGGTGTAGNDRPSDNTPDVQQTPSDSNGDHETPEPTDNESPEPTGDSADDPAFIDGAPTKRVGNSEYGYINIPEDWVDFIDLNPMPGVMQWTDAAGAIISMNLFGADMGMDAITAAAALYEFHEGEGAEMEAASVTLNGISVSAYQVYGYYGDDLTFVVIWLFDGETEGEVHYICAEAPSETIMDTVALIEETYSFEAEMPE